MHAFLYDFLFARPAHNRLDPCLDLQDIKRLCNIVVSPIFKPQNFIHIVALCRQHDNRHIGKLPHPLADFHPIDLWQHQV